MCGAFEDALLCSVDCAVHCPSDKLLHSMATVSPTRDHCHVSVDTGKIGKIFCRRIVVPLTKIYTKKFKVTFLTVFNQCYSTKG